jgi:hypothetical protein
MMKNIQKMKQKQSIKIKRSKAKLIKNSWLHKKHK